MNSSLSERSREDGASGPSIKKVVKVSKVPGEVLFISNEELKPVAGITLG